MYRQEVACQNTLDPKIKKFILFLTSEVENAYDIQVRTAFHGYRKAGCDARLDEVPPERYTSHLGWESWKQGMTDFCKGWTKFRVRYSVLQLTHWHKNGFEDYATARHIAEQYPDYGMWPVYKIVIHELAHCVIYNTIGLEWHPTKKVRRGRNRGKPYMWDHGPQWQETYAEMLYEFTNKVAMFRVMEGA